MKVLGIETSCDETGVAVYDTELGLLGDKLFSQASLHAQYGGVVPELASRDHICRLSPLIDQTLNQTKLSLSELDGIAYTKGPGLMGALLVGAALGRSLAFALKIPAIGVHHMEGHLLVPMLENKQLNFPFLALLVSGGHTQLMAVRAIGEYQMLGCCVDDAVGEAFDKTASKLGLSYPGGPALAQLAQSGNANRFRFPRPMTDRPGLDFSFSGLKTHAITTLQKYSQEPNVRADIAVAFEQAVVDTLLIKCKRAMEQTGLNTLVVSGGVGANQLLRARLNAAFTEVYFPSPALCTDNGVMIAFAGAKRLAANQYDGSDFSTKPRWSMEQLSKL